MLKFRKFVLAEIYMIHVVPVGNRETLRINFNSKDSDFVPPKRQDFIHIVSS